MLREAPSTPTHEQRGGSAAATRREQARRAPPSRGPGEETRSALRGGCGSAPPVARGLSRALVFRAGRRHVGRAGVHELGRTAIDHVPRAARRRKPVSERREVVWSELLATAFDDLSRDGGPRGREPITARGA